MFNGVADDLCYAIRSLRRNPGLTVWAVLSLALGIGANTAIFSLINAVVLAPLPVSRPEELAQITSRKPDSQGFSNPLWETIRDRQDVFSDVSAYGRWRFNLAPGGEAHYVQGYYVSGAFFETLGVRAELGRVITPADDRRGCAGVAVISDTLWRTEYKASRDVLGQTIALNGHPVPIIGVAQPGFSGIDVGASVVVMVPVCAEDVIRVHPAHILDTNAMPGASDIYRWLKIIGRLKPEISVSAAADRFDALAPAILRSTPIPSQWSEENRHRYLSRMFAVQPASTGQSDVRDTYAKALGILMAISGIVLLIACANIGNLLLMRAWSREREIGIRMALGSGRGRILRQFLAESLLISVWGTSVGILLARIGVVLLVDFLKVSLDLAPDVRILSFHVGIAVLTGVMIGIGPAFRGSRVGPSEAMKTHRHVLSQGSRVFSPRRLLVISQISLTFLLVVGAGLMGSTFMKLNSTNPGFSPESVLLVRVDFRNGDQTRERRVWEILDRLRNLHGVEAASISGTKPLCGCDRSTTVSLEGHGEQTEGTAFTDEVSDGYFRTLGVPLLNGREFDTSDIAESQAVAVVNETMTKRFFGRRSPVGRRLRILNGNSFGPRLEIVGVVRDAKVASLREAGVPAVFTSRRQDPWIDSYYEFEVRARGTTPAALIPEVKIELAKVDRQAVLEFSTLSQRLAGSLDRERLLAGLSGCYGLLAFVLALIGLYGTMAYEVMRRRREIGIRIALGATPGGVLRMVLYEAAIVVGVGMAFGLALALWTTRLSESFLFGVAPNDALTLSRAFALLAVATFLASYLQARRAARLEPMANLREE